MLDLMPITGFTLDLKTASYTNAIGDAQLLAGWSDPEFDPKLKAFYYARVLEIPTPRWVAYDEARFNIKGLMRVCSAISLAMKMPVVLRA
ncbi:hypothetical protein MNBD_GAMMA11-399 [hydrothermal vent metagenome]|uniref:Uncharacterized protein n=1 Tax=hydrothermal vent metagenome TaxID=652676 RepID=A0A3B0X3L4_9ZZZZ